MFTSYLLLQATIDCWTSLALMIYDLFAWINKTTGATRYLAAMTEWNRPYLKRLQDIKCRCHRRRLRSPMVYVSANKRKVKTHARLWRKGRNVCGLLLAYCHASLEQAKPIVSFMSFDTDSFPIGVDNCATYCINTRVSGIGGHQKGQWTGTVRWPVVDDTGRRHELVIPNTILLPKGSLPFRLLSPQHFGQENFKCGIDTTDKGTMNFTSGVDNEWDGPGLRCEC
jgi:hypothetical protein